MPIRKLNIGCGNEPMDGYINIDLHPEEYPGKEILGADALHLPFKDGSIDEIYMSHFLEHLSYINAFNGFLEWRRVLCLGGKITIIVPDMNIMAQEWLRPPKDNTPEAMHNKVMEQMHFWGFAIYGTHRGKEQDHRSAWTSNILASILLDCKFTNMKLYRKDYIFWLWCDAYKAAYDEEVLRHQLFGE